MRCFGQKTILLWAFLTEKINEICLIFKNVAFIASYNNCVVFHAFDSTKDYGIKYATVMKITVSGITLLGE